MRRHSMCKIFKYLSLFSTLLLALAMFGCEGDKGDRGDSGSSGTVTGLVTDTAVPVHNLAGITVAPTPAVTGIASATTNASGNYSLTLPNGNYTLTYSKAGYATQTQSVTVVATQTRALPTIALVQTAAAVVNVTSSNPSFANSTSSRLTASVIPNDPALVGQAATFTWTDSSGVVLGTGSSISVKKPTAAAFAAAVAERAKVRQSVYPPGHDPEADQNDFDLPDFETLDRLQVLPIAQQAYENAAITTYHVRATVALQNFSSTTSVSIPSNTLGFVPNGGIRNVAIGQPVLLQGKLQTTWNWTIAGPTGSGVTTLSNPGTRFPSFIPDVPGQYVITETGSGTTRTINIYASSYVGILIPAPNDDPRGILDTGCTTNSCHPGNTTFNTPYAGGAAGAPQFFSTTPINSVFDQWRQSGHSVIMVRGMSEGTHYSLNRCAKCHSVGFTQFSSAIKASGFNEIAKASGFTDQTFINNAPTFFKGFDQVLRKSEVQCETCHGPNGAGGAHGLGTADAIGARFSIAADVCGVCHGEPLRHGRFQEWRTSGHGDFETAMLEGITGITTAVPNGSGPNLSCAGCHTGQGFPIFLAQLQGTNGNTPNPNRTLTNRPAPGPQNATNLGFLRVDNVQPQTCAVCHPVHNPGDVSGLIGNIVILRGDYQAGGAFDGTTPLLPSGFQANGVGRGALCITCHNSRNGGVGAFENAVATVHEDGDPNFGALTAYSGPHEACQGDVLMGRNAYYFSSSVVGEDLNLPRFNKVPQIGQRSAHSFLADACVTCHVQKTPPDPTFGYPPDADGAGTNHSFNIVTDPTRPAADQINALCSQCHGGFNGVGVQSSFDGAYKQLLIAAGNAVLRVKFGSIAAATAAGATSITFIPGRIPQVAVNNVNGGTAVNLAAYLTGGTTGTPAINYGPAAVGTTATGAIVAGFQRDLAKANWNIALVAPKYDATQLNGTSYDNGTPILNTSGGTVGVAGDQSKAVHNPSFVFNLMTVTQNRLNAL
jgi:hypothetical protein